MWTQIQVNYDPVQNIVCVYVFCRKEKKRPNHLQKCSIYYCSVTSCGDTKILCPLVKYPLFKMLNQNFCEFWQTSGKIPDFLGFVSWLFCPGLQLNIMICSENGGSDDMSQASNHQTSHYLGHRHNFSSVRYPPPTPHPIKKNCHRGNFRKQLETKVLLMS